MGAGRSPFVVAELSYSEAYSISEPTPEVVLVTVGYDNTGVSRNICVGGSRRVALEPVAAVTFPEVEANAVHLANDLERAGNGLNGDGSVETLGDLFGFGAFCCHAFGVAGLFPDGNEVIEEGCHAGSPFVGGELAGAVLAAAVQQRVSSAWVARAGAQACSVWVAQSTK